MIMNQWLFLVGDQIEMQECNVKFASNTEIFLWKILVLLFIIVISL